MRTPNKKNSTNLNGNDIKGNKNTLNITNHYPPEYDPELMNHLMETEITERRKVEVENELLRSHIEMLTEENHKLQDQIKELRKYNNKLLFRKP